jgi:endonuclease III
MGPGRVHQGTADGVAGSLKGSEELPPRGRGLRPDSGLVALAAEILPAIDRRLRLTYHTAPLGNKLDPLDELIYIQLSIRTREGTYADIYKDLHHRVNGDWEELLRIPGAEVLAILRVGGMAEVKLARLRGQIERIREVFGRVTLDPLRAMSNVEAESFLRQLPGVGPKAARCVLMYSLDRQVFPVDSHCRRILARLGFLPQAIDRKAADDYLEPLVPPEIRYSLHVNLVHHGRTLCLPITPHCDRCPLLGLCPTGQTLAGQNRTSG